MSISIRTVAGWLVGATTVLWAMHGSAAPECRGAGAPAHHEQIVDALLTGQLFVGTVVPAGEIVIGARVAGRVEAVLTGTGRRVQQGDLLLRIAPPELLHQIDVLQAQSGEAQAAVDKAVAVAHSAEERLARRRSHPTLFPAEEIAGAEYAVEEAEAEIRRTTHALEQIRLQLAKQRSDLADAEIRAPSTGVVTRIDVREGQDVQVDSLLLIIESETGDIVRFLVPESADAPGGGEAMCVYPSDGTNAWTATLTVVSPAMDPRARVRIGEARFLTTDDALGALPRPGASLLLGRVADEP